eukprot:CAMPEP_0117427284 /NCGR_PEP_ID=MMETSP0758-20121206/7167_1 /TAXON_ID=63605 /ORGANISM="Percolomonas cosmopolitus, Strain AE-1 (ATCC 50343)" /LENGTH=1173 /DNA_ID=CAMNT_0005212837 /DNA_START=60 /DNA_END=3578 /DNA_ORIENTATION=-
MALWNLKEELEKVEGVTFEEFGRKQILEGILSKLIDPIVSVQGVAIKCLSAIVPQLSNGQIEICCAELCKRIIEGEDETRDISALALKKVVSELPGKHAKILEVSVINVFMNKLNNIQDNAVRADVLDIMNDIIKRFGSKLSPETQVKLYKRYEMDVKSEHTSVKKRAMTGMAAVSVYLNEKDYKTMIVNVMKGVTENVEDIKAFTSYIQALASISRVTGHRLAPFMDELVDLISVAYDLVVELEDDEGEIREQMMQIIENLVQKCPQQVKAQIELLLVYCKDFLVFDPNYFYDSTDEEEEEGEDGSDDEGAISDDDDVSWKTRKAAAKCITAMIKTQPDQLSFYISELCSEEEHVLISRFKEREESVKLDVFHVFCTLLGACSRTKTLITGEVVVEPIEEGADQLRSMKNAIMIRLKKLLNTKSSKVRIAIFKTLRSLIDVLGGEFEEYMDMLIGFTLSTLNESDDADNQVKLEALQFLSKFIVSHKSANFKDYIERINAILLKVSKDKYYKVVASSFKTQVDFFPLINDTSFATYHAAIYENLLNHLKIQDIDQEVKESVIYSTSCFLATLSGVLSLNYSDACQKLYERLSNEITRLVATKAFLRLAKVKLQMDIIVDVHAKLVSFLKKLDRPLRQSALNTLIIIVKNYDIPSPANHAALEGLKTFLDGSDMYLASLSVQLATSILSIDKSIFSDDIVHKSIQLLSNSTLLETTLASLGDFLQVVVDQVGFKKVFDDVFNVATKKDSTKQIFTNVGHALVSITLSSSESDKASTIANFASYINKNNGSEQLLGLYALGEMGREMDLSQSHSSVIANIRSQFDNSKQDVRIAASYAFGNLSIGNLDHFLPIIVEDIPNKPSHRFLLIHSLKEIIVRATSTQLANTLDKTVPILIANAASSEEGIRNVVSECLGRLTLVNYTILMKELKELALSNDAFAKITVVNALRNAATNSSSLSDDSLVSDLKVFLSLLDKSKESDIDVRRSVILLVSSCAQYKPYLIRDELPSLLPRLYLECSFDKQYERVIDLGPFKHRVDDGLELRKSAFECLDILFTTMRSDLINLHEFLDQFVKGFADADGDIVQLSHSLVVRVASHFPRALLSIVPRLCVPLSKSLTKKAPSKQGLETEKVRILELKKSALHVVSALSKLDVDDIDAFMKLVNETIQNNAELK